MRLHAFLHTAAVLGAVSFAANRAAASEPNTHDGFYLNLGLGAGYLHNTITADPEPAQGFDATLTGGGLAGQFLLGGTPAPGLVVGGGFMNVVVPSARLEINGEERDVEDDDLALYTAGIFVDYYFNPKGGLHLLGYLGFAVLEDQTDDSDDNDDPVGGTLAVALGHDWWVGDEWSIGLLGRLQFAATRLETDVPARGGGDVTLNFATVAPALLLTATYH